MAGKTIVGGADTWVGEVEQAANHNGDAFCLVQDSATDDAYMLLFLNAPAPIKAGVTVKQATLKLHLKFASTGALTFRAAPLDGDWDAGQVTWNNKPSVTGTGGVTSGLTGAGQDVVVSFDVTAQMQSVAGGAKWWGWRISLDTAGQLATIFSSRRTVAEWRRPRMEVEWSNAPAPPTDLSPSGGRSISIAKPVLRYTHADFGGDTDLIAHQIEIDPTDPEGATWDSGWLPTTDPELDLTTTTYPGIANDAAARWHARTRDGAGLESKWSDWAHFERLNKGGLVIDNPAAPPNAFVQEVTPQFGWTHSGPWAQEAWQAIVQQQAGIGGDWFSIYTTGKRPGNDSSWTPPQGVLTRANWSANPDPDGGNWDVKTHYRLVIRTWDGQGREHTPGDRVYYEAIREFDVREGATAPVENLTISTLEPWPYAELTFTRDTAPDKFIFARGGDIIDVVTPDEIRVSGTSYRFVDKTARANQWHVWTVLPVVNGVMSTVEHANVGGRIDLEHIWLLDEDRTNSDGVLIMGDEDNPATADLVMEDVGEVYEIVGGNKRVVETNALPGFRGPVTGVCARYPFEPLDHVSGRDWIDRLLAFRAEPGKRLILITPERTLPVVIRNVSWGETSYVLDRFPVTFEAIEDRVPPHLRNS